MGQFTHFSSYAPWRIKTAWVKALFQRAVKICSTEELLNQQIRKISLFMSWNGFPYGFSCKSSDWFLHGIRH